MSLQLGLIVLPTDTAELNKVLEALSKLGVATSAVTTTTGKGKTTAKEEPEVQTEKLKPVTADQVKAVMTKVRDELGDDIISELLTAFGAEKLKDVDKSDWAALVAAAEAALGNGGSGEDDDGFGLDDDDDGFGLDDDDDGEELDAEEVKVSVQAYAKKHGKEKAQAILVKNGLNTVRGLASADQKTLAAIAKAVK
jgi:nitrogen regulatory protein PII